MQSWDGMVPAAAAAGDGVSRCVSSLETVSRHGFSCLSLCSVSTRMSCIVSVSSFHVSSYVSWYILFVCAYMYVRAAISAAFSLASLFVSHTDAIIITVLDELNK